MKLTATGSGYYRVYKDGIEVSKHTSEREAIEAAANRELSHPSDVITYKHDYEVKVEADVVPVPIPPPVPPIPPSTYQRYSATSYVNAPVKDALTHPQSASLVKGMVDQGPDCWGRVWINVNDYTVPNIYIITDIPKVPVYIENDTWSKVSKELALGIRLPINAIPSGGLDGSMTIFDWIANKEYDFWQMKQINGKWTCRNAGILSDLPTSDGRMPKIDGEWNSATATRLPNFTIRYEDMKKGIIPHVIPFACGRSQYGTHVWPADGHDGEYTGVNPIPQGTRFRFHQDISIDSTWPPLLKMLVIAVRDYGMVLRDKSNCITIGLENIQYMAPDGVDKAD